MSIPVDLGGLQIPKGGVVRGIGIDLIETERIRGVWERQKDRFLKRVYTEGELEYCLKMKDPVPFLAARFSAKEAVSKAFTTGIGKELGWKSIEVCKGERQQPWIRLDAQGQALLEAVGGSDVLVSLSHTSNYGMAVAVLVEVK
jgi:holo-[acyl-carrier protein] synthase|tara:strand:- start:164 stop:595 length:432 start_codon:yes stop_codon:yes gene_type:complete